jgi:iron complex outermembrane receptor protein
MNPKQIHFIRSVISVIIFFTVVDVDLVFAQSTKATDALEEIIVTARKREENIQNTPVSVTPFTMADLQDRGFTKLTEIADATPNMEFTYGAVANGGGSDALVFMRGIGQQSSNIVFDPGVGIYMDGVYLARSQGGILDLVDIERIEVIRGPQGTLFGKNTIGGAINIITTKPTGEFGGQLNATVGNYDRVDLEGLVQFPIIEDKLFAKVAVGSRDRDGYIKRILTGEKDNNTNEQTVRGALRWLVSDSLEAQLNFDYMHERERGSAYTPVTIPGSPLATLWNNLVGIPTGVPYDSRWIPDDPHKIFANGKSVNNSDVWSVALTIDWDLGPVSIKSITAYRDVDSQYVSDIDGTPVPISNKDPILARQSQFSQELQVSGAVFNERLNWIAGAFYFTEDPDQYINDRIFVGLFEALEAAPGLVFGPFGGAGNPANAALDGSFFNDRFLGIENDSYSIFAQGTFDITDKLSLTAGARYNIDEKTFNLSQIRSRTGILLFDVTNKDKWNSFTPRFEITYQITPEHMLYGSVARGFKVGGFNITRSGTGVPVAFDEEYVWTYEGGFKTQWFDDRLRVNGTYYFNDYTGIQLTSSVLDPALGIIVLVQNAGDAETQGFELEMTAKPTGNLDLTAGIGLIDAEYVSLSPGVVDIPAGAELPNTPKWTINLSGQYSIPLKELGGAVTARIDYKYKDDFFVDPSNNSGLHQKSYSIINARLTYTPPGEKWDVSIFGTNLTDKDYFTNGFFSAGGGVGAAVFNPPREWGVSLRYHF